jgi:hypothetical protein
MKRELAGLAAAVLVSGGLGLAGVGAGTAHAKPTGPLKWCPGAQGPPYGAIWDMSHCHTYWIVQPDQGNVDGPPRHNIWDGDNPPASTPPPNLPPFLCRSEFPPETCDAWGM